MKRFAISVVTIALMASLSAIAQEPKLEFEDDDEVVPMELSFSMRHPFVEALVGQSMWSYKEVSDFENSLAVGANLGFSDTRRMKNSSILHENQNSFYLQYLMAGDATQTTYAMESWRFGFNTTESYGYGFKDEGNSGFYLGNAKAPLSWFTVSVDSAPNQGVITTGLEHYEGSLRFGESATALIGVRVSDPVSLNVGFEWAQIYERHLFWYWAMSQVIEGAADGLASWFVRAVGKNSSTALPIMHFILRNGVAMGFKALRMEQMNWPFETEAPINIMTYRVGINVTF
jgi:hypothetical protein